MAGVSPVASSNPTRSRSRRGVVVSLLIGTVLGQALLLGLQVARTFTAPLDYGDWWVYFSSVRMLSAGLGQQIYDISAVDAFQKALGRPESGLYLYHPAYLLLAYPFASLEPGLSYVAWMLFNVTLLGISVAILIKSLVPPGERFLFSLLVLGSLPVYVALGSGQSTFVVLLGLVLLVTGILSRGDVKTGLGLAILLIKPQYLPVLLVLLLWQRRFKSLMYFAGFGSAILLLSWLLVGTDGLLSYPRLLLSGAASACYPLSHSINGIVNGLVAPSSALPVYAVLASVLAASYVLFLAKAGSEAGEHLVAVTVLVSMLISNYLLVYDLAIWAVPLALLWPCAMSGKGRFLVGFALLAPWVTQILAQHGIGFVWPTVGIELWALMWLYRMQLDGRTGVCTGMITGEQIL